MMKKIILIVIVQILIIGNIKGQTDSLRSEQLRVKFWNNRSSDWNTTEVPEKWSSESAVILNKETYYWVKKAPVFASLEEKYHSHSRIKILDDNAINNRYR